MSNTITIITERTDAPRWHTYTAALDGYDGAPDSDDKLGRGRTKLDAVRDLLDQIDDDS